MPAQPAILTFDDAVASDVLPLLVRQLAKRSQHFAQICFGLAEVSETRRRAHVRADAAQCGVSYTGTEIVEHQAANWIVRQGCHVHSDVPTERSPDPVNLSCADPCNECGDRAEVRGIVVMHARWQPIASATAGQIGHDDAHTGCSEL